MSKEDICWRLAQINDIAHFAITIPFMLFGWMLIGHLWHGFFLGIVIGLQCAFLHCPQVVLSNWLRGFKDKRYWSDGATRGFTYWLYKKLGVVAIVPIASGIALSITYINYING